MNFSLVVNNNNYSIQIIQKRPKKIIVSSNLIQEDTIMEERCNGTKKDGERCSYKTYENGFCKIHLKRKS